MTRVAEKQILVAAVGNLWKRDDGFGTAVAKRLREREQPSGVSRRGLRHERPRPRLRGDARLRRARPDRHQPPGRRRPGRCT